MKSTKSLAKTLIITLGIILIGPSVAYASPKIFSDIPSDEWYTDAIESLSEKGIINGYPDGTFGPDKNVNRAELAVTLDKLIKYTENNELSQEYKEFKMTYHASDMITAEVLETWSIYKKPENLGTNELPDYPTASIGQDCVFSGDVNFSQIDLFYAINDISDDLINKAKEDNYETWDKETVAGIQADVATDPIYEDGKVNQGGSPFGGKTYYISLPDNFEVRTLVIRKQGKGDKEFEKGFEHFIETLELKKG